MRAEELYRGKQGKKLNAGRRKKLVCRLFWPTLAKKEQGRELVEVHRKGLES